MSRFMRVDGEHLVLDTTRVRQTARAAAGQWAEGFFTAAGAKGGAYNTLAAEWVESDFSKYDFAESKLKIKVERLEGGVLRISQFLDDIDTVELTFTPAADREIAAPAAKTYFENIAERAKTEDVQKIIADENSKL
jgi:D-Tyr-tRNAtyr deacylase